MYSGIFPVKNASAECEYLYKQCRDWKGVFEGGFGDLLVFDVKKGELQVSDKRTGSQTRTRINKANLAEVFRAIEEREKDANPRQWELVGMPLLALLARWVEIRKK